MKFDTIRADEKNIQERRHAEPKSKQKLKPKKNEIENPKQNHNQSNFLTA